MGWAIFCKHEVAFNEDWRDNIPSPDFKKSWWMTKKAFQTVVDWRNTQIKSFLEDIKNDFGIQSLDNIPTSYRKYSETQVSEVFDSHDVALSAMLTAFKQEDNQDLYSFHKYNPAGTGALSGFPDSYVYTFTRKTYFLKEIK